MKYIVSIFIFLFTLPGMAYSQVQHLKTLDNGVKIIENFESEELGTLPHRWYDYKAEIRVTQFPPQVRAKYKYRIVKKKGNKFLRYSGTKARHLTFPLRKVENLNIYETPILSWQWKVMDLPEGGDESDDDTNDTAASIYVVFEMGNLLWKEVPKSIRYTWSSTLPEGTVISTFFDNQKIVVVESGPEEMGKWITFRQNIVEDYKRLFGEPPPEKPLAILILSDGDSTGDKAVAAYDDIKLMPKEVAKN